MSKGNNKAPPKTSKIVTALKKIEGKPRKRDIIEFSDSDDDNDNVKDDIKDGVKDDANETKNEKKDGTKQAAPEIKQEAPEIKQEAPKSTIKEEVKANQDTITKHTKEQTKELTKALKESNMSDEDRAVLKQIIKQNNEILQQLTIDKAERETKKQVKEQKRLLALEQRKREKELEKIELQKLVLQREHEIKTTMNNNFNAQLIRTRRGLLG